MLMTWITPMSLIRIRSHASRVEGKLRKKDEPDQLCLSVRESDYKDGNLDVLSA